MKYLDYYKKFECTLIDFFLFSSRLGYENFRDIINMLLRKSDIGKDRNYSGMYVWLLEKLTEKALDFKRPGSILYFESDSSKDYNLKSLDEIICKASVIFNIEKDDRIDIDSEIQKILRKKGMII